MTNTVNIDVEEDYKDITTDAEHSLVTAQVIGEGSVQFHVDTRSVAQIATDDDIVGIEYAPGERVPLSDWVGTIRVRAPHGEKKSKLAVFLS